MRMPSDVPSKKTPWVLDGEVTKIVQVGGTMIAAGLFTTVAEPMNGTQYPRANIFAWDKATGVVDQTFKPTLDGQVQQLLEGPVVGGRPTVYVAGDFTKVNGKGPNHLQLLDVNTGLAVPSFKAPSTNGGIETIELLPNNRLFIGGFFTKIAGVTHGELATLNATTGALDAAYMNIDVAGHHNNSGTGAQAPVGPRESGVNAAGDAPGRDRQLQDRRGPDPQPDRHDRPRRGLGDGLDHLGHHPVLADLLLERLRQLHARRRDVARTAPTSSSPPPAARTRRTCATPPARWETMATGTALLPTWVANSGGDTLWGVGISDAAVFVGGHNRWMNNPTGTDNARAGCRSPPGPVRARPHDRRAAQVEPGAQPARRGGLRRLPDRRRHLPRQRHRLDRRPPLPAAAHRVLPLQRGLQHRLDQGRLAARQRLRRVARPTTNVLYRVNAGGALIAATDGGPDWAADTTAAPSPYHNTGSTVANQTALTAANLVNVPATHAAGIWTQERNDPTGGTRDAVGLPGHRGHAVSRSGCTSRAASSPPAGSTCSSTASPS